MTRKKNISMKVFFFEKKPPKRGNLLFSVTINKLRNDVNGNLRYEATIVDISNRAWMNYNGSEYQATLVRFTGHGMSERDEAEWAVDYLLKTF